jgi:hypothetical protein
MVTKDELASPLPDEELTVTIRLFMEFFLTNRKRFRRSAEKIRTGLPS